MGDKVKVLKFPSVKKLKNITGSEYNIVLGNRYLKPKDKIAQHSDNEEFGNTQSIASVSLGVPRIFHLKSKVYYDNECVETKSILLEHGSLLLWGRIVRKIILTV